MPKVNIPGKKLPDHWSDISAVVVTYQPDALVLENLRRLLRQVPAVIVVDNGSVGESAKVVEAAGNLAGVELIRNGSNLGIATALNVGIRQALRAGCQWVATFDQDSSISDGYFEELFRAYHACPAPEKVGMVVPGKCSPQAAAPAPVTVSVDSLFSYTPAAITSGSLTKAGVFPAAGMYDEGLFIDFVDVDFCLQLRKNGFKILKAKRAVLNHELGTKETRNLLGLKISFRSHSTWRHYYMMRNRILLYRRYFTVFPMWVCCEAGLICYDFTKIICLEDKTAVRLRTVCKGIGDGLRGITGRHADFPK